MDAFAQESAIQSLADGLDDMAKRLRNLARCLQELGPAEAHEVHRWVQPHVDLLLRYSTSVLRSIEAKP